jgi:hypothetical protein
MKPILSIFAVAAIAVVFNPGSSFAEDLPPSVLRVTEAGGLIGGTERGFGIGGSMRVEGRDGSVATIEGTIGAPVLRIRGKAEAIPIRIERKVKDTSNGTYSTELTIIPLAADVQLSAGDFAHNHLLISPTFAAEFGLAGDSVAGSVRLRVAPVSMGVVGDADGAGFMLGAKIGLDQDATFTLDSDKRLRTALSIDVNPSIFDRVGGALDVGGEIRYEQDVPNTGQSWHVGMKARSTRFDVKPNDGPNTDTGVSSFVGLFGGMAF